MCPHCGAGYAYEVEVRCVDCDDAMCWFCVTWSGQHAHCPGCAGGGA